MHFPLFKSTVLFFNTKFCLQDKEHQFYHMDFNSAKLGLKNSLKGLGKVQLKLSVREENEWREG